MPKSNLLLYQQYKPKKPPNYWKNMDNIQQFLVKLQKTNNLQTPEDWNSITQKQIKKLGGKSLLVNYSMYDIKCMGFPSGKSLFSIPNKSQGYWDKKENIEKFLSNLKEKLNLNTPEDWNVLTKAQILQNGGSRLIALYSMSEIKSMGCPEGKLLFTKSIKPSGFWENTENIHNFIENVRKKLNLKSFEDWNSLTQKEIYDLGGGSLIQKLSMNEIKSIGFPQGKILFSSNCNKSPGYWDKKENIEQFLDNLKDKLNLKTPEDWNLLTQKQIKSFGGSSLLIKYNMKEIKLMGCPEGIELFDKENKRVKSSGYWNNPENILNFIHNELKTELNLNTIENWNSLTAKQVQSIGGSRLFKYFSLFEIKCIGCPDGILKYTKPVLRKSHDYWEKQENIDDFIDKLKQKLNVNTSEDWKRISNDQILSYGGNEFLAKCLKENNDILSNYDNCTLKFKRSSQRLLFIKLQLLYPDEELVEDYFHSEISRKTGFAVQFDVFVVKRNLAFEYHGRQHYEDAPDVFAPLEMYKYRDSEKQKLCKEFGIHLVIVPYWWDNQIDSLKNTIDCSTAPNNNE